MIEHRAGTVEEAKALVNTLTAAVSRAGRHIGDVDAYAADAVEVTNLTGQIAALFNVAPVEPIPVEPEPAPVVEAPETRGDAALPVPEPVAAPKRPRHKV